LAILHETYDPNGALLSFEVVWLPTAFLFLLERSFISVFWGACDPHSVLGSLWAVRSSEVGNTVILERRIQCL